MELFANFDQDHCHVYIMNVKQQTSLSHSLAERLEGARGGIGSISPVLSKSR